MAARVEASTFDGQRSTRARRVSHDSGEFWAARERVALDLPELPILTAAPGAERATLNAEPDLPRIADTANLATPDAAPAALQPRSLARDVTALVLGTLAGLAVPAGLLVLYALS